MSGKVYVDPLLTNVAKGFRPAGHINELILPVLPVIKPTAKIASFGASNLRIVTSVKAPEGETPTVMQSVTQADAYVLEEHALKAMASDYDAENQDSPFDVQRDRTEFVTDLLSVSREYGLATYMNTSTNFANKSTPNPLWSAASPTPLQDVMTAIASVAVKMGKQDSEITLVFSDEVWRKFRMLSDVKGLLGFAYNQTIVPSTQQVAAALGIKQILVGGAVYNSAKDGQTDVLARMWGKHCWAVYIPSKPALKETCFGFTPRQKNGIVVDKWYDNDRRGFWVRATDSYDQYIMDTTAVYMLESVIS